MSGTVTFGGGGDEPWARALDRSADGGALVQEHPDGRRVRLDLERWTAEADAADRAALTGIDGPVLDVGSGPGRMVRAALDAGLAATGIDVSAAAVRRCRAAGLPVLQRDVFGPVPREGRWGAVLLIDGNIGIGGDPAALLARCRELLVDGGSAVVEAHPESARDVVGPIRVLHGRSASAPFAWAEVGAGALARHAVGFDVEDVRLESGRCFVRLRSTRAAEEAARAQRRALRPATSAIATIASTIPSATTSEPA